MSEILGYIAGKVTEFREKNDLSVADFATLSGLSRPYIYQLEDGTCDN
jgi:transcriptional regulator with XRE-family HTH domain